MCLRHSREGGNPEAFSSNLRLSPMIIVATVNLFFLLFNLFDTVNYFV